MWELWVMGVGAAFVVLAGIAMSRLDNESVVTSGPLIFGAGVVGIITFLVGLIASAVKGLMV